jgi:hypothetical protein
MRQNNKPCSIHDNSDNNPFLVQMYFIPFWLILILYRDINTKLKYISLPVNQSIYLQWQYLLHKNTVKPV